MIQNIIWGQAKTSCTETCKTEFSGMASYSQVFEKKKTQTQLFSIYLTMKNRYNTFIFWEHQAVPGEAQCC